MCGEHLFDNHSDPEDSLMERRIGVVAVLVTGPADIQKLNGIISSYSNIILGRQGMPLRDRGVNIISLIVDGSTDEIGALTGKIGRLGGIQVKSVLTNYRETGTVTDGPDNAHLG
jgi:putative iron-only hydrogenase system regulator